MALVGLVGWRGMVGSVLMDRMQAEGDFALIEPLFFSTSNAGGAAPSMAKNETTLQGRHDIDALKRCDIVITCQGGDYTTEVFPKLRAAGWKGHWIDAAKTLRMKDDAVIILDPVNLPVIQNALAKGGRNWIGGNCTVSCMLMGVGALYKAGLVEWMSTMTYQAASGRRRAAHARAAHAVRHAECRSQGRCWTTRSAILEIDRQVVAKQRGLSAERRQLRRAAGRLADPLDRQGSGQRHQPEEWKGGAETNKILGQGEGFGTAAVPVDGFCVRVGRMRCHSQALTFKLKKDVPLADLEAMIAADNAWVKVVPNTREAGADLTPVAVTGTMTIPWAACASWRWGPQYLGAFTIGDQLLWGAAEPLRRMLRILLTH
jgi:aspartate-semialdehyde dehydrogenase